MRGRREKGDLGGSSWSSSRVRSDFFRRHDSGLSRTDGELC